MITSIPFLQKTACLTFLLLGMMLLPEDSFAQAQWVLINKEGKVLQRLGTDDDPRMNDYGKLDDFAVDGWLRVKTKEGKQSFLNHKGEEIPSGPFIKAQPFQFGYAVVNDPETGLRVVNKEGEFLSEDIIPASFREKQKAHLLICKHPKKDKLGVMNLKTGDWYVKPKYKKLVWVAKKRRDRYDDISRNYWLVKNPENYKLITLYSPIWVHKDPKFDPGDYHDRKAEEELETIQGVDGKFGYKQLGGPVFVRPVLEKAHPFCHGMGVVWADPENPTQEANPNDWAALKKYYPHESELGLFNIQASSELKSKVNFSHISNDFLIFRVGTDYTLYLDDGGAGTKLLEITQKQDKLFLQKFHYEPALVNEWKLKDWKNEGIPIKGSVEESIIKAFAERASKHFLLAYDRVKAAPYSARKRVLVSKQYYIFAGTVNADGKFEGPDCFSYQKSERRFIHGRMVNGAFNGYCTVQNGSEVMKGMVQNNLRQGEWSWEKKGVRKKIIFKDGEEVETSTTSLTYESVRTEMEKMLRSKGWRTLAKQSTTGGCREWQKLEPGKRYLLLTTSQKCTQCAQRFTGMGCRDGGCKGLDPSLITKYDDVPYDPNLPGITVYASFYTFQTPASGLWGFQSCAECDGGRSDMMLLVGE